MRVGKNDVNRKVFSLKDFRGVDYASSPLEVKPYRATDMANLLLRDGQLQKRYGFRQTRKIDGFDNNYDVKIYPPFTPKIEDVSTVYVVQMYDKDKGETHFSCEYKTKYGWMYGDMLATFENTKMGEAVEVDGTLYIFCGKYIKTDGETFEEVTDENVYIPTTTINIPAKFPIGKLDDNDIFQVESYVVDESVAFPYLSNEPLNLLTRRHKVALSGCQRKGDTAWWYYKLPHRFFIYNIEQRKIKMTVKDNNTGVTRVYEDFELRQWGGKNGEIPPEFGGLSPGIIGYDEEEWRTGIPVLRSPSTWVEIGSAMFYKVAPQDKADPYAAIVRIPVNYNGKFKGFPLGDGSYISISDATIYIEFEDVVLADSRHLISTATSATLFGVDGANDRIFIGGNDETPNIVYFSENDISLKPNPTYFPADQFLVCGSSNAPISGFMRVTDGTLAIFKDTTKTADVSVYYANGYYQGLGTGEEGNTYQQARFTVKAGGIKRRGIFAKSIANLEGDNIFTSAEGVYGIQLSDNVASGERYARERSRTINPKITKLGLANAKGIVYEDKYFLAVDNGEVYVADARYKFTLQGDQQNTYNYEWFRLTGLWVKAWFILDNKLHFIDKDGYICEITEDSFADQYLVRSKDGELTMHVEPKDGAKNGTVTFNSKDRLALVKASSYAIDGKGRKWQLELINDNTFKIPDNIINEADIVDSGGLALWFCVPVTAYWQSAVMDLGAPMYLKNMWSLSMVVSAKHGGKINLGYKTRMNSVSNIEVEGANDFAWGNPLDLFGGMQTSMLTGGAKSFGMYTFDVGGYVGINTYRRRLFDRNFAHIQLLFTSETTTDCAVAEMDIEYSIARKNIGVG